MPKKTSKDLCVMNLKPRIYCIILPYFIIYKNREMKVGVGGLILRNTPPAGGPDPGLGKKCPLTESSS